MKIPQFQYTSVPRAQTIDTAGIASAARAQMGVTKTLVDVTTRFAEQVEEAEAKAEYTRIENAIQDEANALWNEINSRPSVGEDGVPIYDNMRPDFEAGYKKITSKYTDQIKHHGNRASLADRMNDIGFSFGQTVDSSVRTRRVDYVKGQTITALSNYELDVSEGMGKGLAKLEEARLGGVLSEVEYANNKEAFIKNHDTNRLKTYFQNVLETDIAAAEAFAAGVQMPESFGQAEIDAFQNYMAREVAVAKTAVTAKENENWTKAKQSVDMLLSGYSVSEAVVDHVKQYAATTNDPDRQQQAQLALTVYEQVQNVATMTFDERQDALAAITSGPVNTPEDVALRNATAKAVQNINRAIDQDAHQAWITYGGGEKGPSLYEIGNTGNPEDLTQALRDHIATKAKVEAWVGRPVAMLSAEQAEDLVRLGPNAIPAIAKAYGREDGKAVLGQLYSKNARELALAGTIALEHDGMAAFSAYVKGSQALKDDDIFKADGKDKDKNTPDSVFNATISGVYQGDSQHPMDNEYISGIREITDKIYAGMAAQEGDRSGVFNAERYKRAIDMATGGVIVINGRNTQAAYRGQTAESFQADIETLTMEDIDAMGGFMPEVQLTKDEQLTGVTTTIPPESILGMMHDGEVTYRATNVKGKYTIHVDYTYTVGTQVIRSSVVVGNKDGQPFILDRTQG